MDRSNEQWLADLQGPESRQQTALADLRHALLRGLRQALAGNPQAGNAFLEDAVQDALLIILDRLGQFQGRSRFVTWATTIAIRTALTELRRHRWKDRSLEEVLEASPLAAGALAQEPPPVLPFEQQALLEAMYRIIRHELTDRQRTALLAELEGVPQVEIARHLGSNRNAVYKLAHDARKRLKGGLEAAGYRGADIQATFNA